MWSSSRSGVNIVTVDDLSVLSSFLPWLSFPNPSIGFTSPQDQVLGNCGLFFSQAGISGTTTTKPALEFVRLDSSG
jgi:hypothetical protein